MQANSPAVPANPGPRFDWLKRALKQPKLAYCDFIADRIHTALTREPRGYVAEVGHIESDLDPVGGWFRSTKKTITVADVYGTRYRVTVEEAR